MKNLLEKAIEFVSNENGVSLIVRPLFPFVAEGFRQAAPGKVEIFGAGRMLAFDVPAEILPDLDAAEELLLCEFPSSGQIAVRELILLRV